MSSSPDHPSLFGLNLNLLPVLEDLLHTRSVSKTAARIGKTQPTVSRILADMRSITGDPLLVRSGGGMRLTERGEALLAALPAAMSQLDEALATPQTFDPAKEKAHFRIATADYVTAMLAPRLVACCAQWHPNIAFDFKQSAIWTESHFREIDVVIAPLSLRSNLGKSINNHPLWHDDIVCLADPKRQFPHKGISQEQLKQEPRLGFYHHDELPSHFIHLHPTDRLDHELSCRVGTYMPLGTICEETGYLAIVPRKFAQSLVPRHNLKIVEIADTDTRFAIHMFWSIASGRERRHEWLRSMILDASGQIRGGHAFR